MTEDDLNFMRAQIMQAIPLASPPMVRRIHEVLALAAQERALECDETHTWETMEQASRRLSERGRE